MTKLAFLGLGVMGYPMAGHLFNAGHNIKVYNRTTAKAVKWTAEAQAEAPSEINIQEKILKLQKDRAEKVGRVRYCW